MLSQTVAKDKFPAATALRTAVAYKKLRSHKTQYDKYEPIVFCKWFHAMDCPVKSHLNVFVTIAEHPCH